MHVNFAKGFRGGERQTQLLIEQLSLQNFKQKLLVRKNSKLTTRCEGIKGLEIVEISKPYIFHAKHARNVSIIHAHETKAFQFAYLINKLMAIPYIGTRRVAKHIKNNFFNRKMYANASAVAVLSNAIKSEVSRIAKNAKVQIIPSSFSDLQINERSSSQIRDRFKGKFLIGHVGALVDSDKGQSLLIEAARELSHAIPEAHFIFLGEGKDREKFKLLAEGLNNITFEGFVNNVYDYITCFDLFVFPSHSEGLGSILLDVMQLEVPIIASNVGGIPDIVIDEKTGLLTPPNDAKAIQNAIFKLYNDVEKRKLLAKNAKENMEKFSPFNMANLYISVYNEIWSNN